MEDQIAIKAENVTKVYKLYDKPIDRLKESLNPLKHSYHHDYYALRDVSFEVRQGETVGVIGKNGAGKSTLLKVLTGVTTPTSGTVMVKGRISALLELGAGFNPEYTGMQNIYLNGTMMGYSSGEMESRAENILNFADIGDYINQPVKNYSSGMFARLAFAVAINVEPEVLIVDEALSVGDVFFQNKCFRKFEELRKKGISILFVSHDIGSVKQMCSRVLWLDHGEKQMFGEKREVCNAYSNSIQTKSGAISLAQMENQDDKREYRIQKFNLQKYPPVTYSNESQLHPDVKILSCFILDSMKRTVTDLDVEQEYTAVEIFESKTEIEKCIAGFVLETVKGLWVINCNSAICDAKKDFAVKSGTITRVEFGFRLPKLMKGDYVMSFAVSSGEIQEFHVLTWLYNVMKVHINNPGPNSGMIDLEPEINIFSSRLE